MTTVSVVSSSSNSAVTRTAWYGLVTLVLTSLHHAYGAWVYDTPWRYHVVVVSALTAAIMLAGLRTYRAGGSQKIRTTGKWVLGLSALGLPVLGIGLFEGIYNHVIKNVLHFGGASPELLAEMFPPPRYEMPNDVVFEITGLLQVIPAVVTALYLVAMIRDRGAGSIGGGA